MKEGLGLLSGLGLLASDLLIGLGGTFEITFRVALFCQSLEDLDLAVES